jgi:hypothetical protein
MEENRPDAAVLDVKVKDGICVDVAKKLHAKQIPFLLQTGFDPHLGGIPPELLNTPIVSKPIDHNKMLEMIAALLPPSPVPE